MVLEGLGGSLRETLKKISNATHIDKDLIKEVVRDIQRALIQADMKVQMVLGLTKEVERRALTEKPPSGMSSREHVIRIIYQELVSILGKPREVSLGKHVILMVGLYGQGKTTTTGKLARYFHKRGLKTAIIAGDVHRPAAYEQLQQLTEGLNIPVFGIPKEKKAAKVVRKGLLEFEGYDVVLIDTSGRHSLEADLTTEIKRIATVAQADETLLILDAAVGQQAGPQAAAFHEAVGVTGVVITKLDGTAKGGGALSAVSATEASIVFIGVGEHIEDLEKFEPSRFISRLLGMGDLETLMEKAQEVMDEDKAEKTAKRMLSGKFDLYDLQEQMEMLSGMGKLSKVFSMLPGVSGKMSEGEMDQTQNRLKKFKIIMSSMTDDEMKKPKIIKKSRVNRIALGAGVEPKEVKEMIKHYNQSKKMIKGLTSNRKMRRQLMKQFGGMDMDL